MQYENYFQPDTLIQGKLYYVKTTDSDLPINFLPVKFVDYRPHPAEVLVWEGSRTKVIHRVNLLQKNGRK
jgi:hypothetical protein